MKSSGLGNAEDLGADQDAEEQLDDDDRRRHAARKQRDRDRGQRSGQYDEQEGAFVDVDHWRAATSSVWAARPIGPRSS